MAYEKTTWISGQTPLSATNLNHIEDGVEKNSNDIAQLSNLNLLINGDFRINQRGKTSYTYPYSDGNWFGYYTVDRWRFSGNTPAILTVNNDGTITITNDTNTAVYFTQVIENDLPSGNYTASCEVVSFSGSVRMDIENSSSTPITQKTLEVGINKATTNGTVKYVTFMVNYYSSVTLKFVKLEKGSIATPFVPRPYAEELAMCERYFQKGSFVLVRNYEYGTNQFGLQGNLRCPMRDKPTVTIINVGTNDSSGNDIGASSTSLLWHTNEFVRIKAIFSANLRNNTLAMLCNLECDAEMYS